MTIDYYYTEGSNPCRFVQLLAKNLNIELNLINLDLLAKKEQLKPEFLKINPQHCVPLINDNGFILWESSSIATYLIRKYSKNKELYPSDLQKKALIDQRLFFNASILLQRHRDCYFYVLMGMSDLEPEKLNRLEEAYQMLEAMLENHKYVCGDSLTVADYALGTTLSTSVAAGFNLSAYKNINKWFNSIQQSISSFQEFNSSIVIYEIFEKHRKLMQ